MSLLPFGVSATYDAPYFSPAGSGSIPQYTRYDQVLGDLSGAGNNYTLTVPFTGVGLYNFTTNLISEPVGTGVSTDVVGVQLSNDQNNGITLEGAAFFPGILGSNTIGYGFSGVMQMTDPTSTAFILNLYSPLTLSGDYTIYATTLVQKLY